MIYFISIVHALTCIFIVLFILLQDPKGGVLGSLGGGAGGKSFFGSEGASPFLVTVTKWLAIMFACSSFYLSYMSSKSNSIMEDTRAVQTQPLTPTSNKDTNSQKEAINQDSSKETSQSNKPNKPPTSNKDTNSQKEAINQDSSKETSQSNKPNKPATSQDNNKSSASPTSSDSQNTESSKTN